VRLEDATGEVEAVLVGGQAARLLRLQGATAVSSAPAAASVGAEAPRIPSVAERAPMMEGGKCPTPPTMACVGEQSARRRRIETLYASNPSGIMHGGEVEGVMAQPALEVEGTAPAPLVVGSDRSSIANNGTASDSLEAQLQSAMETLNLCTSAGPGHRGNRRGQRRWCEVGLRAMCFGGTAGAIAAPGGGAKDKPSLLPAVVLRIVDTAIA
jgi:hypothetical protein